MSLTNKQIEIISEIIKEEVNAQVKDVLTDIIVDLKNYVTETLNINQEYVETLIYESINNNTNNNEKIYDMSKFTKKSELPPDIKSELKSMLIPEDNNFSFTTKNLNYGNSININSLLPEEGTTHERPLQGHTNSILDSVNSLSPDISNIFKKDYSKLIKK